MKLLVPQPVTYDRYRVFARLSIVICTDQPSKSRLNAKNLKVIPGNGLVS